MRPDQADAPKRDIQILHPHEMSFTPCGWAGRDGVEACVLRSERDGPITALVRYPARWRSAVPDYLEVDEAFIVTDGALVINGTTFGRTAYTAFSPGAVRLGTSAPDGALALTFFSGRPRAIAGMAPTGLHVPKHDVVRTGLYLSGWDSNFDLIDAPSWSAAMARVKLLRRDSADGDASTFIIGVLPMWSGEAAIRYASDLELFVLEGDVSFSNQRLDQGAYAFIPAGSQTGPLASTDGATILLRSIHGPYREIAA